VPDTAGQVPDTSDDPPARAFTLTEAAAMLGVSTRTVRRRLQSRKLEGEKVSGSWVVYLRTLPGMGSGQTGQVPDTAGQVPDRLSAVVEAQQRHIETLERELEQRNSELRAMHLQVERLTRALPAPEDPKEGEPVARQSLWSRWFGGREK